MSLVTIITPTGYRPEAFELCKKYVKDQTYKGELQWIIVSDDANIAVPTDIKNIELYTGPKVWHPGINTQRPNLDLAISKIKGDYIFVFEDEDFYRPDYIETFLTFLKHSPLVGLTNNLYYNLQYSSYKEMQNYQHSSLASTAFRKEMIPDFERAVNSGEKYFDIEMWKNAKTKLLISEFPCVIGIKSMPGRPGIGSGHRPEGFTTDYNMQKLHEWIGPTYAKAYEPFYKSPTPPTAGQSAVINGVRDVIREELKPNRPAVPRRKESFPTGKIPPIISPTSNPGARGNQIAGGPGSASITKPALRR